MFKFDEYPEIKKAHEMSDKLDKMFYRKERECMKKGVDISSNTELGELIADSRNYKENEYARLVYETFKGLGLTLTQVRTGEKLKWDALFEKMNFEDIDSKHRKYLYMMIEEERPYRLPDEYYDEKDWYEECKNKA